MKLRGAASSTEKQEDTSISTSRRWLIGSVDVGISMLREFGI